MLLQDSKVLPIRKHNLHKICLYMSSTINMLDILIKHKIGKLLGCPIYCKEVFIKNYLR